MEGQPVNSNDMLFAFVILPPLIALINQKSWSREVRALVALSVCVAYSVAIVLLVNLTWADWRSIVWQVLIGTLAAYKLFWEPSNISHKIEDATEISHGTPPASVPPGRSVPPDA